MTSFDERQKQFEARFANDADARFRAEARRDKLVGQWAAGKLGYAGDQAEAYARSVIHADMEEAGSEDVFRKLRGDLPKSVTDEEIRQQMMIAMEKAMEKPA